MSSTVPVAVPEPLPMPAPPALVFMGRVACQVGPVVSLGGPARHGERRYVSIGAGTVQGPELQGALVEGGVDWQVQRGDGVTDISAHYVVRCPDGALVEVQSDGIRHGPPEVMARLARGEEVPRDAYYFRTAVRFTTGHPDWLHLNRIVALSVGQREPRRVLLEFWRVA